MGSKCCNRLSELYVGRCLGSFPSFSSVQSLSRVRVFETPWTAARQAYLSFTNSQSLLKLMSIESVMAFNHPFLLLPSIFPSRHLLHSYFVLVTYEYYVHDYVNICIIVSVTSFIIINLVSKDLGNRCNICSIYSFSFCNNPSSLKSYEYFF